MLNRRAVLAGLPLAAFAAPSLARGADPLTLWGPPASPALVIAHAVTGGFLKDVAPGVTFRTWKSPDEMRAGLSSGRMEAVVVPSYVAANLYNRSLGTRLANILTDGLLYVVAAPGVVAGPTGLKGRRVGVPLRNDMPDFIFRRVLASAGLTPADLTIEYTASAPEAAQLLLAGRLDAALLSEPAGTAVIAIGGMAGKPLERAIDCQKIWSAISGRTAIPQAGLAVTGRLIERLGAGGVETLQASLEAALQALLKDPEAAARAASTALELPAPMIERSIPFSHLVVRRASAAKEDLVAFFDILARDDAHIIGGKLPDDGFYAA